MSESNKKTAGIGQQTEAALQRLEYIEQLAKGLLARVEMERSGIDPSDDQVIGTVDIDLHAMEIFLAAARNPENRSRSKRLVEWMRERYSGCGITDESQIPHWILPEIRQEFVDALDLEESRLRDGLMRAVNYKAREFYHYRASAESDYMDMHSCSSFGLAHPSESEDLLLRIPIDMSIHEAVRVVERLLDWMKRHGGEGYPRFRDMTPF